MISLIIQGPMLSKGITGKLDGKIVEYDCRKNIDEIVSKYCHIFDYIVLCSWENDELAKNYNNPKIKKLLLNDKFKNKFQKIKNNNKINNKERQFYSVLKGCEFFEKKGYEGLVLKIRSDQIFNLKKIKDFSQKKEIINSNKIYVPFISQKNFKDNSPNPIIHFSDYYFLGKLKNIKSFCKIQLYEKEKSESIHRDAFFRYAWKRFGKELNIKEKYYFSKNPLIIEENKEIVLKVYDELFAPMLKEFYDTLIWRGKSTKGNNQTKRHIYYEDWFHNNYKKKYLDILEKEKHISINFINYAYILDLKNYCINSKFIKKKTGLKILFFWEVIGKYYSMIMNFIIKVQLRHKTSKRRSNEYILIYQ
jgi:hypothetical protein